LKSTWNLIWWECASLISTTAQNQDERLFGRSNHTEFGERICKSATSPAKRDLFEVSEDSATLNRTKAEIFHSVAAKLLYVSHRGRMDIQLAIAFLCTMVSCSTEQDWAKLNKRVLEYLNGTLDEFRVIGVDDISKLKTWADASYAVHRYMKSHTGGVVSFVTGAALSKGHFATRIFPGMSEVKAHRLQFTGHCS
jgi:hypothetical protein